MLGWIKSRLASSSPSDHPLGSDKGISAYLAEIPTADPQATLRELNEWLGDPSSLTDHMPADRAVRVIEALDEFAQDAVARCWQAILKDAQNHRVNLAGSILKTYFANSHACNRRVADLLTEVQDEQLNRRQVAHFAARAMHSWIQLKKLSRMAYQAPDPAWWGTAHALLQQCRDLGIHHLTLSLYPQQQLLTSVWKEYQSGLVFETAPLTNLTINEIDAADRLVRWIEPHCKFVDSRSTLTPFCIVPIGDNMPTRWQEDKEYGEDIRFFGLGQGQNQLIQLRVNISRESKVPDWLSPSGCNREQLLRLLQQLVLNWSANPPSRRHPRLKAKGTIRVVNGLDIVRRMLAASEFAKSGRDLDYDSYLRSYHARHREHAVVTTETEPQRPKSPMDVLRLLETAGDQQMMDCWEIIDVSHGGLGVRFNARRPWQRIGALVAYRQDDELDWHVGIIRRLGSSHGKPNAGLSSFPGKPQCSQVRMVEVLENDPWQQRTADTSGLGWQNAILLSAEAKLLIVPTGIFSPDRHIHISIDGRWWPVRLIKLQGRGNDYELAVYQETPAEA